MRLLAIGDIHGCWTALQALVAAVDFQPDDVVVTLGDYVDRGHGSKEVIDYLIGLKNRLHLIPLRGNHEVMMLEGRDDTGSFAGWLSAGGEATLMSYGGESWKDVPATHWQFLEKTLPYHETELDFFVHANANPERPLADQSAEALFWERVDCAAPHESGKRMICGHTPQHNGQILDLGFAVCIDTWAYGGQWLTCLDVHSNCYWQANEKGEVRIGALEE